MARKAQYTQRPEPVTSSEDVKGNKIMITIALNPVEKTRETEEGETETYWEADTTVFSRPIGTIDLAAVKAAPEDYLDLIDIPAHVLTRMTAAADAMMKAKAQERGYDDINSASKYIGCSVEKFSKEGEALRNWAAEVYAAMYALLDQAQQGKIAMPTDTEAFLSMLPTFTWPV